MPILSSARPPQLAILPSLPVRPARRRVLRLPRSLPSPPPRRSPRESMIPPPPPSSPSSPFLPSMAIRPARPPPLANRPCTSLPFSLAISFALPSISSRFALMSWNEPLRIFSCVTCLRVSYWSCTDRMVSVNISCSLSPVSSLDTSAPTLPPVKRDIMRFIRGRNLRRCCCNSLETMAPLSDTLRPKLSSNSFPPPVPRMSLMAPPSLLRRSRPPAIAPAAHIPARLPLSLAYLSAKVPVIFPL
ncbi:hypothetical protein D3C81_1426620 [compost metagenome]